MGGRSPAMGRRMGGTGDGGLPLLFPPEHFATAVGFIREGLDQAARSVNDVDVAACIWCSVSADRQAAEDVLKDKIAYYGHALSPLILQHLGVDRREFEPIERAIMVARDVPKARQMVTPAMLRIGILPTPQDLIPPLATPLNTSPSHLTSA